MKQEERPAIDLRLDAAAQICLRQRAQLTPLRRAVLGLIIAADGPLTAYQLLDRLKETRKGAVPPTVYRALDFLLEQGLIHKIERLSAFVACVHAEHSPHSVQFLICGKCGTVVEIEDPAVSEALTQAAERAGFRASMATVELDGTCAACAHKPG